MNKHFLSIAEIAVIVLLSLVPLFVTFPYRVNIFLSWEGAYRISEGQLPFRDFGIPLGGMYWAIPALFFKIFGSQMITLVKAQVFINIISGLAFRSILKSCHVIPGVRFISVVLYCISFSFFNFWPWYNHSVIVYEFIAIAFLLVSFNTHGNLRTYIYLVLAALFTCLSFLTKQDGGGLCFVICLCLALYISWLDRKAKYAIVYTISVIIIFILLIAPFLPYRFGYWFNHGQPPHTARVSISELLEELLSNSQWLKFYFFLILLFILPKIKSWKTWVKNRYETLFLILTIAIITEAAIYQVTSYTPPDNNIYFHSFAFAFILSSLASWNKINFNKGSILLICLAGVFFWWSSVYWKYMQRIVRRNAPEEQVVRISPSGENIVNHKTYMLGRDSISNDKSSETWVFSPLKSFYKIYMPQSTVDGMNRLMKMNLIKNNRDLRVLNMSELTPLAKEIPFKLEHNGELPLWYHLGVGMFNKQAELFEKRITNKYYDLVLFEYIPSLNNFYPFRVRDSLLTNYNKIDSFPAPRRGDTQGTIEVFVKPNK